MKDFAYFNDTFSITKTNTYQLSILLKPSGLTYTIVDTVRKKCVAIKNVNFEDLKSTNDYHNRISDTLSNDSFLAKNYKGIDFIFSSRKSTLVPMEYFDKKLLRDYYTTTHQLDEFEEIHFNKLDKTDTVNIFSIPSDITTLMVNQFPELKFYHQASTFIDSTIRKSETNGHIIGVMVYRSYFDISVCDNGKLYLYNNLDYANEADFVYHIVNIYQQLNIPDGKTNMYLSGDVDKDSKNISF
ncbi:MAG: DUF3822 family protein [Chloroflexia bacterium]|nr:DUF3822 family protein [Chloroflexia bacterium]